jgi:hypothetical protein
LSIPQNFHSYHRSTFIIRWATAASSRHTFVLSPITNRHNAPGDDSKSYQGTHQGMDQFIDPHGMTVTPTAHRIAAIIANIPRLIRNIRHHIPQANFQVGFTSLSIYFSSLPCFLKVPSLSTDWIVSMLPSIHYNYGYSSMSICLRKFFIKSLVVSLSKHERHSRETGLPFLFVQANRLLNSISEGSPCSSTERLDHIIAFQTIAKRAVILTGTDTAEHR